MVEGHGRVAVEDGDRARHLVVDPGGASIRAPVYPRLQVGPVIVGRADYYLIVVGVDRYGSFVLGRGVVEGSIHVRPEYGRRQRSRPLLEHRCPRVAPVAPTPEG